MTRRRKNRKLLAAALCVLLGWPAGSLAGDAPRRNSLGEIKNAARRGATWLTRQQNADGSYGGYRGAAVGTTAMVLWTIATSPAQYRETDGPFVSGAVQFLLSNQNSDGSLIARGEAGLECYNTSLSVLALAALDNPRYAKSLRRAHDYMLSIQNTEAQGYNPEEHPTAYGAIGYGTDRRGDLSNTSHAFEAIAEFRALARRLNIDADFDDAVFRKGLGFIRRCSNDPENSDMTSARVIADYGAQYGPWRSHAGTIPRRGKKGFRSYGSMTYARVEAYIYANLRPNSPEVASAFRWISRNYTLEENPGMGQQGLYYYYHMMAKAFSLCGQPVITDSRGRSHNWAQ